MYNNTGVSMFPLERLPTDIQYLIYKDLTPYEKETVRVVCKGIKIALDTFINTSIENFKNEKFEISAKNYQAIKELIQPPDGAAKTTVKTYHKLIDVFNTIFTAAHESMFFVSLINQKSAHYSIFNDLAKKLADRNLEKTWGKIKEALRAVNHKIHISDETRPSAEEIRSFLKAHSEDCTRVRKLDLDDLNLTEVPMEIFDFTGLQELWLVNNRLSSFPLEIGKLSALQHLSLDPGVKSPRGFFRPDKPFG
jgi:Leucine-rich repeat (LRR) protein